MKRSHIDAIDVEPLMGASLPHRPVDPHHRTKTDNVQHGQRDKHHDRPERDARFLTVVHGNLFFRMNERAMKKLGMPAAIMSALAGPCITKIPPRMSATPIAEYAMASEISLRDGRPSLMPRLYPRWRGSGKAKRRSLALAEPSAIQSGAWKTLRESGELHSAVRSVWRQWWLL
jgi:hypothetical protein